MTTYVHKWKCLACGLHAEAFSWQEDWRPLFCPECGSERTFLMFDPEESDMHIFEHVPGHSHPKMITTKEKV